MYNFYMGEVQLPVAPAKMKLKISNKNKTLTLLEMGEVNTLKRPGLSEISFSAMIPSNKYPFAIYPDGFREASFFLDHFEKLKVSKEPFQFIVSRLFPGGALIFDTNISVSLEDYEIVEDAGGGIDFLVNIKLKQYKAFGSKKITLKSEPDKQVMSATVEKQRPAPTPDKTYTVKSGDTLWKIARMKLGDGSKYLEIAKLNDISNPNKISAGQVIRLE
ncbi:MAG: LysM peptidoglycan-binding domain-containing protein [Alkaliphilus sp.]